MAQRKGIEDDISKLPESFSAREILVMYDALKRDMTSMKDRGVSQKKMEVDLHSKHKTLSFSYPATFFKIVRGEMSHDMFLKTMFMKHQFDKGHISKEDAQKRIIDHVAEHIKNNPNRPVREPVKSEIPSQEFVFNRQVEEEEDK